MTALPDTLPCRKCGDEGHIVCRPNIYTLVGDLYTVDCENLACGNSTNDEHSDQADAILQWNAENKPTESLPARSLDNRHRTGSPPSTADQ